MSLIYPKITAFQSKFYYTERGTYKFFNDPFAAEKTGNQSAQQV